VPPQKNVQGSRTMKDTVEDVMNINVCTSEIVSWGMVESHTYRSGVQSMVPVVSFVISKTAIFLCVTRWQITGCFALFCQMASS